MRAVVFDLDQTVFGAERQLYAGVLELLTIMRRLGFKIGAITGDDHRALVRLDEAGVRHFFDSVLCSDHIPKPKTSNGMQRVLDDMGVEARHSVMVSTVHTDITLGKHSGMAKTIGVSHGHTDADGRSLFKAGADHIVHDFAGILDVLE